MRGWWFSFDRGETTISINRIKRGTWNLFIISPATGWRRRKQKLLLSPPWPPQSLRPFPLLFCFHTNGFPEWLMDFVWRSTSADRLPWFLREIRSLWQKQTNKQYPCCHACLLLTCPNVYAASLSARRETQRSLDVFWFAIAFAISNVFCSPTSCLFSVAVFLLFIFYFVLPFISSLTLSLLPNVISSPNLCLLSPASNQISVVGRYVSLSGRNLCFPPS